MVRDTLDTIDEVLEDVVSDVDDPDVRYRIRNVRQRLELVKTHHKYPSEASKELVDDDEILNDLRELGSGE